MNLQKLREVSRARWRMAITLSAVVGLIYFCFILLIAFNKEVMGRLIVPGLSLGIALGALVIVAAWITTLLYILWANRHVDTRLTARRGQ